MTVHLNGHLVDPVIVDYVSSVTNRFGAGGLEDLIALAQQDLAVAKAALAELADGVPDAVPDPDPEA